MNEYFGSCVDGHLHQIKPDYVNIALHNSERSKSTMFELAQTHEPDILNETAFIPLPPTNCPDLATQLPFERLLRKNKLPEDWKILPFRLDATDQRTPIAFLSSFEAHGDRISETKVEGKQKLYALIKQAFPTLTASQVEEMSYESLRETFLRQFWSMEHQRKAYSRFVDSSYPMHRTQKVHEYVYYWLDRLTFNTIYLTRDIVEELIARIPAQYEPYLKVFVKGANLYDVYQTVYEVENNILPAGGGEDDDERSSSLLGGSSYLLAFRVFSSLMFIVFGIAIYYSL